MRQMKRNFCAVIVSASLLTAHAQTAPSATRSTKGYSIVAPNGWRKGPANFMGTDLIFVSPTVAGNPPFAANLVVTVGASAAGGNFEQEVKKGVAVASRMLNKFRLISRGETRLGGQRAWMLIGTHEMGTPPRRLRFYAVGAPYKNKIYSFTGTATNAQFARYQPLFQKAVSSVRWTR